MSWIRTLDESPSAAALATAPTGAPWSTMTALWTSLSLEPSALDRLLTHGTALVASSSLSPAQIRLVALVVSATDGCGYAVAHFGPALAEALGDEGLARAVALDYREANLAARDRVLLDYAVALTCEPAERKREDIERVREYGFDDAAILRATHLAAWIGLLDRLASGLGVEREPHVLAWEYGTQR